MMFLNTTYKRSRLLSTNSNANYKQRIRNFQCIQIHCWIESLVIRLINDVNKI